MDDLETKFSVGTYVVLYGLQSRDDLNGKCGQIVEILADRDEPRWAVKLIEDGAAKPVKVKHSNLFRVPSDHVESIKKAAKKAAAHRSRNFGGLRAGFMKGRDWLADPNQEKKDQAQVSEPAEVRTERGRGRERARQIAASIATPVGRSGNRVDLIEEHAVRQLIASLPPSFGDIRGEAAALEIVFNLHRLHRLSVRPPSEIEFHRRRLRRCCSDRLRLNILFVLLTLRFFLCLVLILLNFLLIRFATRYIAYLLQ